MTLVNSTTDTLKKICVTDRAWFSHCTTSGQETERVYSYNPGAHTGQKEHQVKLDRTSMFRRMYGF